MLKLVCNRVSYVEMTLRDNALRPPIVATIAIEGGRPRQLATERTLAEIAKQGSKSGHQKALSL